jgi:hypothetical protein
MLAAVRWLWGPVKRRSGERSTGTTVAACDWMLTSLATCRVGLTTTTKDIILLGHGQAQPIIPVDRHGARRARPMRPSCAGRLPA